MNPAQAVTAGSALLSGATADGTGVAPSGAVRFLGVTLVGVSATTGVKRLFTLALIVVVVALQAAARVVLRRVLGGQVADPRRFWARQGLQVITAVVLVLGVVSIWITPTRTSPPGSVWSAPAWPSHCSR